MKFQVLRFSLKDSNSREKILEEITTWDIQSLQDFTLRQLTFWLHQSNILIFLPYEAKLLFHLFLCKATYYLMSTFTSLWHKSINFTTSCFLSNCFY